MNIKQLTGLFIGLLLLAACSSLDDVNEVALAAAADRVEVVTEADVDATLTPETDWYRFERGTGDGTFVTGPATPPLGTGSFQLSTPDINAKVYLFNYEHVGQALADINSMAYSTYRDASSTATDLQLPAINIEIDYNGDETGGYAVLVFEPYYTYGAGAIQEGTWQYWDAYSGGEAIWWSSRAINGVCAFSCFVPWDEILAANPDATILGGYGVNAGGGNAGLLASTDVPTLGAGEDQVTYNFEEFRTPASTDECKNGGWQNVTRPDGTSFKNQGQCIKYVNTGT